MIPKRPVALTIAGSDPGGGAGVQADLKTFAALGVYGYSAISAIIAQNSRRVLRVEPVRPAMVAAQIEAATEERRPTALKTGALGDAAVVRAVAWAIVRLKLAAPVVDPVMISTSGRRLLDRAGETALRTRLIPLAAVVTPNLAEARALTGIDIDGPEAAWHAAQALIRIGARAVIIKGGHLPEGLSGARTATDLFHDGHRFLELSAPRIRGLDAHGTGCAFSAAIAAYLARGVRLEDAAREAKAYVTEALRKHFTLGGGRPLLDHFLRSTLPAQGG